MGRGSQAFQLGGQRRTILCPCGHHIQGHPTQLTLKLRLHRKVCDQLGIIVPEYNKQQANANGWGGVAGGKVVAMEASVFNEGVAFGTINVNSAYEEIKKLN